MDQDDDDPSRVHGERLADRQDLSRPASSQSSASVDALCCALCGGPHPFDTSLPSVVWNTAIRARGLPEYLCLTCIVQEFAARGESFTATLWGGGKQFHGLPIEMRVDSQDANHVARLSEENTRLRAALRRIEDNDTGGCRCEHDDEHCCALADDYCCPFCIAAVALSQASTPPASTNALDPSASDPGTPATREKASSSERPF